MSKNQPRFISHKSLCKRAKNGINSSLPISISNINMHFVATVKWSKWFKGPIAPNPGPIFPRDAMEPTIATLEFCSINPTKMQILQILQNKILQKP